MGLLRLVLAFYVAAQHLGGFRYLGTASVYIFFVISGYLMTRVMAETYGYSRRGFSTFWTNRALRLLPVYFAVLALSVPMLHQVGEEFAQTYVQGIGLPDGLWSWLQNLTMLYVDIKPNEVMPRVVPPTWALTLELVCYFLISLGISRSHALTRLWLGAGVVYFAAVMILLDDPYQWAYFAIPGAFVPFAVGALVFHEQRAGDGVLVRFYRAVLARTPEIGGLTRQFTLILACLALMVALVLLRYLVGRTLGLDRAALLVFASNLVPGVLALQAALEWRAPTPRLKRLDQRAGDMAYPVYLAHFFVGITIAWIVHEATGTQLWRGPVLLGLTTVPLMVLCYLLVVLIDIPVQKLRGRVRKSARGKVMP